MDEQKILQTIRERAQDDIALQNKIIRLGEIADEQAGCNVEYTKEFIELTGEISLATGLFDKLTQSKLDFLLELFMDSASELAYHFQPVEKMTPGPLFQERLGHIFLSWTVKQPRDRECLTGVKNALDWFNIDYFNYLENQLEGGQDREDEITQQIEEAVGKSLASIEIQSTEANERKWVKIERYVISKNEHMHRFLVCLEQERAHFMQVSEEMESRMTRIDMSGGRSSFGKVTQAEEWLREAADTSYFARPMFLEQCYELGWYLRRILERRRHRSLFRLFFDATRLRIRNDGELFIKQCQKRSENRTKAKLMHEILQRMPPKQSLCLPKKGDPTCLDLDEQGLDKLPADIGQMTHLKELFARKNNLKVLPESIGNLTNLEVLHLSGNQLSSLPASLTKLKKLRILGISNNCLTELPQDIGEMRSLEEIHARTNSLTTLPTSMGRLENLVKLNVSKNELSSIPVELAACKALEYCFLHWNPELNLKDKDLGPSWPEVYIGAKAKAPAEIIKRWIKKNRWT